LLFTNPHLFGRFQDNQERQSNNRLLDRDFLSIDGNWFLIAAQQRRIFPVWN
jgi:hypothetical protein